MAQRKRSATVQLKVRLKESVRRDVERTARERGISLNAEAVDRIESGTLTRQLSAGAFDLSDLERFRTFALFVRLALNSAGASEGLWLHYSRLVPFPLPDARADCEVLFAKIVQAVRDDRQRLESEPRSEEPPSDASEAEMRRASDNLFYRQLTSGQRGQP